MGRVGLELSGSREEHTGIIAHHFAIFFVNLEMAYRKIENHSQDSGDPPSGKMAARGIPAAVFRQPAGDVMAGGADDSPSILPDFFKIDNAHAAVLIQDCGQFQLGFDRADHRVFAEVGLEKVEDRFLGGIKKQIDSRPAEGVF